MINIKATLQRTEKGLFRPVQPQPSTPQEVVAYKADLEAGASADRMMWSLKEKMDQLQSLDDSSQDFNSEKGLVVTANAPENSPKGSIVESSALSYDPATGQIGKFESEVRGHKFMEHTGLKSLWNAHGYAQVSEQTTYVTGPLLCLSTESKLQNPTSEKKFSVERESLTQLPSGLFEYEHTVSDNLRMRQGRN